MKNVSFNEAQKISLALGEKALHKEWITIFEALGRVLAKDIVCQKNLPSFNNAAMDGFAFKHQENLSALRIKTTILAGMSVEPSLGDNECYKIMTGAKVPQDADTIIPFEDCLLYDDEKIVLPPSTKKGEALRLKGEEQKVGSILLQKGSKLGSREIALLASQGITMIEVYRKLRIAIFSTGDELKLPWQNANEDEIYDVNATSIGSLLAEHGFIVEQCGIISDNLEELIAYFSQMKQYDVLITSGGVSMGEADFVLEALSKNGFTPSFHGINIKPGKPTMMGKMEQTVVAALPGNPLAAYVNAFLFLLPLLKNMQGQTNTSFYTVKARNTEAFKAKSGRINLVLGSYDNGDFKVFGKNKYGSGMLTPLFQSNALYIGVESKDGVLENEEIEILLLG